MAKEVETASMHGGVAAWNAVHAKLASGMRERLEAPACMEEA
jgi:hypothetical protein